MSTLSQPSPTSSPYCEYIYHSTSLADPSSPAIFELRDLNDNLDLQRVSGRLLAMITSITPSLDLIEPLMSALISILQDSKVRHTMLTPHGYSSR